MPVSRTVQGRLAVIRCIGDYQTDALIATLDAVLATPEMPLDARLLLDLRESQSVLKRSIPDLRRVCAYFLQHADRFGHRIALLVRGRARYGLMRMAATWVESDAIAARVFRDPSEASAWLLGDDPASSDVG